MNTKNKPTDAALPDESTEFVDLPRLRDEIKIMKLQISLLEQDVANAPVIDGKVAMRYKNRFDKMFDAISKCKQFFRMGKSNG